MSELISFIGFYLAGLALNLTPCVYPMLSVTVALFGKGGAEASLAQRVLKASMYVFGMATMYSTLGVIASLSGGFFGVWLANKWVLMTIGLLMFILALGMFGLYQFQLPSKFTAFVGSKRNANLLGIYIAGLFVGVFAAPCIGPPVVALLTLVGTINDPVYGFFAFFILSLGLGTPYWILGIFSNLMEKLPSSGAWLIWVERLFGVLLFGTGVYFLALAFVPKLLLWVMPVVLVLGGLYLGFLNKSGNQSVVFKRVKWGLGVLVISLGIFFLNQQANRAEPMVWEEYSEEKLAVYREEASPIMIDFFADWCIPCHEMDKFTFSNNSVAEAVSSYKKLRVDVTSLDAPESKMALEKFQVRGVPTLIFYNSRGEQVPEARIIGFLPPEKFLEKLKLIE